MVAPRIGSIERCRFPAFYAPVGECVRLLRLNERLIEVAAFCLYELLCVRQCSHVRNCQGKVRYVSFERGSHPWIVSSLADPSCQVQTAVRDPAFQIGLLSPLLGRERSEEHTSELQSRGHLVCRLLLEKKNSCYQAGNA